MQGGLSGIEKEGKHWDREEGQEIAGAALGRGCSGADFADVGGNVVVLRDCGWHGMQVHGI